MMFRQTSWISSALLLILAANYASATVASIRGSTTANSDAAFVKARAPDQSERELQEKACSNTVLGVVRAQDVSDLGLAYLEPIMPPGQGETGRDIIFQTVKYDLQVVKLCSSCRIIDTWFYNNDWQFPANYRDYCDEKIIGYRNHQSFLAFLPMDSETDDVLAGKQLRPFMALHASRPNLNSAPTTAWPGNLTDLLAQVQAGTTPADVLNAPKIAQYVPSLLYAASGSVSLMPDYLGYGDSRLNRATFWQTAYEQSSVIGYLALDHYLQNNHPCSVMDKSAITIQGVEDGAFGAVFAAQALRRFKVEVLKVFASQPVFDLDLFISNAIRRVDAGGRLELRTKSLLDLIAFSFSVSTPGLANTGHKQDMVSEEYREGLIRKMSPPRRLLQVNEAGTTEALPTATAGNNDAAPAAPAAAAPDTTGTGSRPDAAVGNGTGAQEIQEIKDLDVLNPHIINFYRSAHEINMPSPCKSTLVSPDSTIAKLCEVIAYASAWPMLLSDETQRWNYIHPTEVCYSDSDFVVSSEQVEGAQLTELVDLIYKYEGPIGVTDDTLKPIGSDHKMVTDICRISSGLMLALQGHASDTESERPQYQKDLDEATAEACAVVVVETEEPTEEPTAPPTVPDKKPIVLVAGTGGKRNDTDTSAKDDKDSDTGYYDEDDGTSWIIAVIFIIVALLVLICCCFCWFVASKCKRKHKSEVVNYQVDEKKVPEENMFEDEFDAASDPFAEPGSLPFEKHQTQGQVDQEHDVEPERIPMIEEESPADNEFETFETNHFEQPRPEEVPGEEVPAAIPEPSTPEEGAAPVDLLDDSPEEAAPAEATEPVDLLDVAAPQEEVPPAASPEQVDLLDNTTEPEAGSAEPQVAEAPAPTEATGMEETPTPEPVEAAEPVAAVPSEPEAPAEVAETEPEQPAQEEAITAEEETPAEQQEEEGDDGDGEASESASEESQSVSSEEGSDNEEEGGLPPIT